MAKKVSSNYDFFVKTNVSKYRGEWLAIAGKKIVAHGKKADEVYKAASKKIKSKNISLAKAPNAQMLGIHHFGGGMPFAPQQYLQQTYDRGFVVNI